ncbi:MAG: Wzz/FepE/Etk N-terminal domain-containing protein [Actinomycetota bacterium]|nr:Wzz/FepE/Etk N-terminal domain-containing protein [Actinomycetota bacterium]
MDDISTADGAPTVSNYLAVLRRRWWIIALGLVVGIVGGVVLTLAQPKVYSSSTSVLVRATGVDDGGPTGGRTNSGINLDTEAQLVKSQLVASLAKAKLKSPASLNDLLAHLTATVPPNTQVLAITFDAPTPAGAQAGSRAFAVAYLTQRATQAKKDLDAKIAALTAQKTLLDKQVAAAAEAAAALAANSPERAKAEQTQSILSQEAAQLGAQLNPLLATQPQAGDIISEPNLPTTPTSPNLMINLAGAVFAGLLIGLALALLANRLDRRIESAGELAYWTDVPVLVEIPRDEFRAAVASRLSRHGRHFGQLRNAVLSLLTTHSHAETRPRSDSRARVVHVLGASPGDGTGIVAANLCAVLARQGHPVTLVCADPDSSSPAVLGVTGKRGLTDLLGNRADIAEAQQRSPVSPNVYVVVAGTFADGAGELVPEDISGFVDALLAYSDLVVIESSPARDSAEGQALAGLAEISLGVVELRRTRQDDVVEMARQFSQVDAPLAGLIVVPQLRSGRSAARARREPAYATEPLPSSLNGKQRQVSAGGGAVVPGPRPTRVNPRTRP